MDADGRAPAALGRDAQKVLDGRALGRGDNSDPVGMCGQGPLAALVEVAQGRELLFQGLEAQVQVADPVFLHQLGHQLVRPARGVHADAARGQHLLALGQGEGLGLVQHLAGEGVHPPGRALAPAAAEPDHGQHRVRVAQGKVHVAGRRPRQVPHLPPHPHERELPAQHFRDGGGQFADGEDVGHGN